MSYTACKCVALSLFVMAFLLSASSIVLVDEMPFPERVAVEPVKTERYALTNPADMDVQLEMPIEMNIEAKDATTIGP